MSSASKAQSKAQSTGRAGTAPSSSTAAARKRAAQLLIAAGVKSPAPGSAAAASLSTTMPPAPTDLGIQEFERTLPLTTFSRYSLKNDVGDAMHWRIGSQSAEDFAQRLGDRASDVLFQSRRVAVLFAIGERYTVRRTCSIRGAVTTARMLRAIEDTAVRAATLHLSGAVDEERLRLLPPAQRGRPGSARVTAGDVRRYLGRIRISHLMCARIGANRVYVRFASS